ncbi:MAG: hypothetical protein PHT59_00750 [Candidatus Omnitrophica bacterium]|nr:hypothetical protein [Candidatus Omnitrophota bacterium]
MDAKTDKIIGYALLGVGLVLIVIAAHNVYSVFTGVSAPPEVLRFGNIMMVLPNNQGTAELVTGEVLNKFGNLMLWYIFMFFLVTAGNKIAGLGITLAREIKVTVKSKDGITSVPTE